MVRTVPSHLDQANVIQLTQTSYVVLGLVGQAGEATPYDLKQIVAATIGNFFGIPHSQLYAEPERLAKAGYLSERRERTGRRRKHYALTEQGRKALEEWLETPTERALRAARPGPAEAGLRRRPRRARPQRSSRRTGAAGGAAR